MNRTEHINKIKRIHFDFGLQFLWCEIFKLQTKQFALYVYKIHCQMIMMIIVANILFQLFMVPILTRSTLYIYLRSTHIMYE